MDKLGVNWMDANIKNIPLSRYKANTQSQKMFYKNNIISLCFHKGKLFCTRDTNQESRAQSWALLILVRWQTIPEDADITYMVASLGAAVVDVALDGIHQTALALFNDAHMIRIPIRLPVEKDDIAGAWFGRSARPPSVILEPVRAPDAVFKFWNSFGIEQPGLIGTPAHKHGTPLRAFAQSPPAPVGAASHIADLRQRYLYDGLMSLQPFGEKERPNVREIAKTAAHQSIC